MDWQLGQPRRCRGDEWVDSLRVRGGEEKRRGEEEEKSRRERMSVSYRVNYTDI